jgi:tetratricopeptide (TPR) repeat protein
MNIVKIAFLSAIGFSILHFAVRYIVEPLSLKVASWCEALLPGGEGSLCNILKRTIHLCVKFTIFTGQIFLLAWLFTSLFVNNQLLDNTKTTSLKVEEGKFNFSYSPNKSTEILHQKSNLLFVGLDDSKYYYKLSFSFKINNGNKEKELGLIETRLIWELLPSGKKVTQTYPTHYNIQKNGFYTREHGDLKLFSDSKLEGMRIKLECDFNNHSTLASNWVELVPQIKTIPEYKKIIELNPKDFNAHNNLGVKYADLKRYNEAITEYEIAIKLDPENSTFHFNLGNAYKDLKLYDNATSEYKKAIELDPKDARTYYNLGVVYAELKLYDKAITEYEIAIKLDPKNADVHNDLGVVYANLKRYDEAINQYKKAIKLDPKSKHTYHNLGLLYKRKHKKELAERYFAKQKTVNALLDNH